MTSSIINLLLSSNYVQVIYIYINDTLLKIRPTKMLMCHLRKDSTGSLYYRFYFLYKYKYTHNHLYHELIFHNI